MDGSQCRREAIPGTNVCNQHGALIPAVQASAARRIQMSVDDAVKRLHSMLDDNSVESREKIKILHDLLDRGGLAATNKHLVGVAAANDPVEKLFMSILGDPDGLAPVEPPPQAISAPQPEGEVEDLIGLEKPVEERLDVVDAEVVEDDAAPEPVQALTLPPKHIRDDLERLGLL
jgi:hypothetical protein